MPVSEKERHQINTLVAQFEADTGIEAVAAITGKADAYPEIPWKAYAIGSALGVLAAWFSPPFSSDWTRASVIGFDALIALAAGAALAIAASFVPPIGRLFLDRTRARLEAQQYAQSMFLERELFGTVHRRAVLILLCCFERIAVIKVDKGLMHYADAADLEEVEKSAAALYARGDAAAAVELALDKLRALMQTRGLDMQAKAGNELDNSVVTEKGA